MEWTRVAIQRVSDSLTNVVGSRRTPFWFYFFYEGQIVLLVWLLHGGLHLFLPAGRTGPRASGDSSMAAMKGLPMSRRAAVQKCAFHMLNCLMTSRSPILSSPSSQFLQGTSSPSTGALSIPSTLCGQSLCSNDRKAPSGYKWLFQAPSQEMTWPSTAMKSSRDHLHFLLVDWLSQTSLLPTTWPRNAK